MHCPACDKPMIALEVDRVEVDYCVRCEGTWLDAGELEILLDGAANKDELLARMTGEPQATERPRACPICDERMEKVACGDRTVIDSCARNHGLWFDRGELNAIIARGEFPGDNRVSDLLSDIFPSVLKGEPT